MARPSPLATALVAAVVLLASLAASAHAVAVTINPKLEDTTFEVSEGFKKVFEFKLDEPIICPNDIDRECNVVIKLTNSHPHQIALDSCHVKWLPHQWTESRFITVRAVEDFVDDGEKYFTVVTEPIDSASLYYNGLDMADMELKTRPRPSAVCRATGDPHYRTFDGYPFHIYAPGRVVFYKSTVRNFEVQTDMYSFSRPAVHCAIAAREGNDIVVINLCQDGHTVNYRRSCGSTDCASGSYPKVGITGSSRPRYVIDFASGARVTAQINYWWRIQKRYINVYVTAPGVDYGNTEGVCGNNDGNPNNDIDVHYNGWIRNLNKLYESQRPKQDLFSWYPEGITEGTTLPPFAEECDYQDPAFVRPILNNPDIEDITSILKDSIPADREDAQGIEFDGTVAAEQLPAEWTEEQAGAKCDELKDHPVATRCLELFPEFPMDAFLDQCVEDLIETGGDPDFFDVAIDALEDQCADFGNRDLSTWEKDEDNNPVEPDKGLQTALCPKGCSGNGECVEAKCICFEHFSGEDCSLDRRQPATLERADPPRCDTRGRFGCPQEISVYGNNFWQSDKLACRFGGSTVTKALFLSALEVRCEVPDVAHSGSTEIVQEIEVTTDGETWSSNSVTFTWYDSICQICNDEQEGGACMPNPNACTVDGVCYLATQHNPDNVCQVCMPEETSSAWVFDYENGAECGPQFDAPVYQGRIVGSGSAGDHIVTVSANNELVAADASNTVTYSIRGNEQHIFAIDADGRVTLTEDLQVTEELLHNMGFENLVHIVAEDSAGNSAEASLYVELQLTNSRPLFSQTRYTFSVDEDAAVGAVVGRVTADDADGSNEWGQVTYSWSQVEANTGGVFLVDSSTGDIKLGKPLDFESKDEYDMRLGARDGGGQSHTTQVVITIKDVNEKPQDMQLAPTSVAENQAQGTVVGTVSVTDPDAGDSHTLSLDSGSDDFTLVGSELRTARAFDFENEDDKELDVTITATDKGGNTLSRTFTVQVTNVNEAPSNLRLANEPEGTTTIRVPEAIAVDRIIADVDVDDVDSDIVGCTLTQTDGNNFVMRNRRIVVVRSLDFETDSRHELEVVCADDEGVASEPLRLTVEVVDNNDGPENVQLALNEAPVPESTSAGTELGAITAEDHDHDSGDLSFALGAEAADVLSLDQPACQKDGDGVTRCSVSVTLQGELNYEATEDGAFSFVVRVTDSEGMANEVELFIPLANTNDAPTGVAWLSGGSVVENAQPGDVVGELVVADQDIGQLYTVQLTSHTDAFEVQTSGRRRRSEEGGLNTNYAATIVVRDASVLNAGETLSVGVSVTDQSDDPLTATFTIDVVVEREPLSVVFDDGTHFAGVQENTADGTVVANFVVRGGPEGGRPLISLKPRATAPTPFLVSGTQLVVDGEIDFERHQAFIVDVSVTFPNLPNAESIDSERFTVYVNNVDEPIAFVNLPQRPVRVNTDNSKDSTVFRFDARDPEAHTVRYTLLHDDTNGLFALSEDGALRLTRLPSSSGVALGTYGVEVQAQLLNNAASAPPVTATLEVVLHDDCDGQTCSGNGRCVDAFRTFTCKCNAGFTGDLCDEAATSSTASTSSEAPTGAASTTAAPATDEDGNPINVNRVDLEKSSQNAAAGLAAPAIAGIVVGVLVVLMLVALVVVLVVRRRRQEDLTTGDKELYGGRATDNPMFVAPHYGVSDGKGGSSGEGEYTYSLAFQPGATNPLYGWYQPDYTRQETTNELLSAPMGSFIVRDSKATPGWHMLGVRTDQAVVHEKIRRTEDGMYMVVPANNRPQPAFPDLPSLVGYYGSVDTDAGFRLNVCSLDNPMYSQPAGMDGQATYEAVDRGMWTRDEEAPAVPLKEREKQAVQQFVAVDQGDLYLNTTEAKEALADA